MAKLFNRAKMTTSTTGTGTITLGSASNGFQSFADAGVTNGDVVQYVIEEGANFEIGTGTYTASSTTLSRTPSESSNSNNAITLAGQATVSITAVAADMNRLQHGGSDKVTVSSTGASVTGNLAVSGTVDGRDLQTDGSKLDGIAASANNYSLPLATSSVRGGAKIGYTENGKNYPVELSSEKMFVNVPWTNTTYSQATSSTLGLVKIGYSENGKNYPVELSSGQMYVNVPWTDTDTASVTAAGALMDSEVTNLAQVKAFDSSDYATAAQGTKADNAMPKAGGTFTGDVTFDGDGVDFIFDKSHDRLLFPAGSGVTFATSGSVQRSSIQFDGTRNVWTNLSDYPIKIDGNFEVAGAITVSGNVDGRDIATDGSKLDGIESGAEVNDPAFKTISVSGQSNVVADADADTLTFAAGSNVTITTNASTDTVTIASTDTNTNQLTTFVVEDGDGTEVTISHNKEWKFVEGGGIDINWTDTSTGSDGDPYDLTFTHADTSSQGSVNNSNGTVIQDVTLDGYGHVTALGSVNLDNRYTLKDHIRSIGTPAFTGGTNPNITTAQLVTEMENDGSFDSYSSVFKTSWSYAGNYNLSDAGGFTETAGTSWLTWTDNSSDSTRGNITALAIAPNTGGSAGGVFIYNDQGSSYSPGWREVWTSMTDGSGSGLDADLLDGQHGSHYLNYNNLTNTPTIPSVGNATITLSAGTGLSGGGDFTTNQSSNETITFNLEAPYTYIDTATGNYGTVKVDDDRSVTWAGYAIRDDWVFMSNGATTAGLYNDTDNEWHVYMTRNGATDLRHNGTRRLQTESAGVSAESGLRVGATGNPHNSGGLQVTPSTDEKIVLSGSSQPYIRFQEGTTDKAFIQWLNTGVLRFYNQESGSFGFYSATATTATRLNMYGSDGDFWGSLYAEDGDYIGILDGDGSWAYLIQKDSKHQWRVNNTIEMELTSSTLDMKGNTITEVEDIGLRDRIYHDGDTNCYIQFHATDQWRVVTGGTERLEVNNTNTTVQNNLIVNGTATFNGTVSGVTASARNGYFWENDQTITSNQTITNNKNAMSAGPITINNGVTVTIGDGEAWSIV